MLPRLLFALVFAVPAAALAQSPSASASALFRSQGQPGTEPIVAETPFESKHGRPQAAIVRIDLDAVALVVAAETRPGVFEIVARSGRFTVPLESSYGTAVELFAFDAPDRLSLSLTSRSGCGRSAVTHRFALRRGEWVVTGLDIDTVRCTDDGVEPDWSESANYITGKTVRTVHTRAGAAKRVQTAGARRAFPLSKFPPDGPESAYAELR